MKPTDDMGKLIKKLHIEASSELDRQVHNDISEAMAESEPAVRTNIWRMKLTVAAAIIVAFGVGFLVGQRSKPTPPSTYSADVTGYASAASEYLSDEDGFWRQKAMAAMQPRPYTQGQLDKTGMLENYRQYLKEKRYD